uniref:Putative YopX protein n=1 Tax=viral metagenome TaxID=1070528 RepID=A0A6M3IJJ7_9ZZZZ
MKNIKFRQIVGQEVTYWGFFENKFHSPIEGCPSDLWVGVKDKNGNDIYENDILYHDGFPCSKCGHIENNDFWKGNYIVKIEDLYCYAEKIGSHMSYSMNELYRLEIVGNIHQNETLLEEPNDTTRSK